MMRRSLRGTHTQVAIVEDQINSMGDCSNCQKGDYPNLTLGDDGGRSSRHSGQWGNFRGGKCLEYVPTRSNFPTVIQLGILPDYLQQYLAEYILYICGKMQNIQTDFPAGIIMGICWKIRGIFGVGKSPAPIQK